MSGTPGPRVLLDACVLYPPVLRDILMRLAAEGRFRPLWSPRILAEWAHAAGRHGPASAAAAAAAITGLRAAFPAAEVLPEPEVEATIILPDPADAHVLAAALAGEAEILLTLNLRDFPARALAFYALRAEAPDAFLLRLWLADPSPVETALHAATDPTRPLRAQLRRAGLPRLGKAVTQGDGRKIGGQGVRG